MSSGASGEINADRVLVERLTGDVVAHLDALTSVGDETFATRLHELLAELDQVAGRIGDSVVEVRRQFLDVTEPLLGRSRVIGHGRRKPYGYAGDFQIIDWTYNQFVDHGDPVGAALDQFYHAQIAPQAVRDRKDRFGAVLGELAIRNLRRPLAVLNVGSGPCRELVDGATAAGLSPSDLDVVCVDNDARSISYAQELLGPAWQNSVTFHHGNALRFRPRQSFDLVWSGGLFDYLDNRPAVSLLTRLWAAVAPGGRLVVGNFADTHPTRPWIEWCGDWFLIHRSLKQMRVLGLASTIPPDCMSVYADRWGAIGYLDATRPPYSTSETLSA